MKAINPYINFPGNTEEAFNFYKSIFGGEFLAVVRFKDTAEADKLSDNEKEKIMHIALPIGEGNILMGTDVLESMGHEITGGTNFHLLVMTNNKEEADKYFNGLSQGGKVALPMTDMFWGDYYGQVSDKFGIQWMVSYTYPKEQ